MSSSTIKERIFISKYSLLGFFVFGIIIALITITEILGISIGNDRLITMVLGLTIITFMIGIVIDQLIAREFRFWALGAIIAFIGVATFFSPIVLYGIGIENLEIWLVLIFVGILLILFGYTVDAYELNKKVAIQLINFWETLKNFQWKAIPKKILLLFVLILVGISSYALQGLKRLKTTIIKGLFLLSSFINQSLRKILTFFWELPRMIIQSFRQFYNLSYFLLIPAGLIIWYKYYELSAPAAFSILVFCVILLCSAVLISKNQWAQMMTNHIAFATLKTINIANLSLQYTKQRLGLYRCAICNNSIQIVDTVCPRCQNEIKVCNICKLPINDYSNIIKCPHCYNIFHQNHWSQWISMGKNCPICHELPELIA